ncbi:DNA (cytosine-5)-methyltransferase 1 [Algoriphagus iocasae]|uniref:DNA (cytosine-5-)-methyltransferase n=1 Tax=Algoriphagus iocasae TaxID=1836499 RepID=A0A841N0Q3_9BACT|nr:DNA cytosine methyltransferase [Algoriphagus iocasae]MBB6328265.1 DNA (cytosine-5)-methyltransferase 1 [Algoriphagus iocasae]
MIDQLKNKYPLEWENANNEAWCFELPYPEEFDKNGKKKGGYKPLEILERNKTIDDKISKALKGNRDFLLIGGPPCQAYSLVGRSRNQGISNSDHRVHLYKEYLRIIANHHPAVFVMENVKGLLSAEVDDIKVFDLIKKDLKDPGRVFTGLSSPKYKIYSLAKSPNSYFKGYPIYENNTDFLIKSEKYGVPQRRHRVILLGIREDIKVEPIVLSKMDSPTILKSVIGKLPRIRSGISKKFIKYHPVEKYADGSPKRIYQALKDSDQLWENIMKQQVGKLETWGDLIPNEFKINSENLVNGIGKEFLSSKTPSETDCNIELQNWYKDPKIKGVANHESRSHLTQDLMRYMFAALYTKKNGDFPRLIDYAEHHNELIPDHANVDTGKFADRFRVQVADKPATTVTSHISKDGHYFIHYDPMQCRSLTVREAARVQTFPDNYLFCGSRTAQYHQVGNAVPPFLAKQIGEVVLKLFSNLNND